MSFKEYFLAVVGTILIALYCSWIDEHDETLTTPEIVVHGHSSTN